MDERRFPAALAAIAGMAFWWPFLRNSITGAVFAGYGTGAFAAVAVFAVFLALVLAALPGGRADRLFAGPAVPAVAAVASAGNLLVWSEALGPAGLALGVALFSAAGALLPVAWAHLLKRLFGSKTREVLLVLLSSYALSFVVGYLSYLPAPLDMIRPVGAPALSGALLYVSGKLSPSPAAPVTTAASGVSAKGRGLYACVVAAYLISVVPVGFVQQGSATYEPSSLTFLRDTVNIVIACCLLAATAAAKRYDRLPLVAAVTFASISLAGFVMASAMGSGPFNLGVALISAGTSCLSVLVFSFAWSFSRRGPLDMTRSISLLFTIPAHAHALVWSVGVAALVDGGTLVYGDFWGVPCLLVGAALNSCVVAALAIFALGTPAEAPSDTPSTPEETPGVILVAQRYSLTDREKQIVGLLCRGNTFAKIGDVLCLSPSTVQTHAKGIYRKMGVHSKQEVVDEVFRAGSAAEE